MRQEQLFTKTRREAPKDEVAVNAQLLIRGGFIHKEMAGVYDYLPLGLRVLNKINNIIREEMDAIGGQEMHMTVLQNKEVWEKTGRWESFGNWFKSKIKDGVEVGLGFTHEEPLTELMKEHISSYRDLPKFVYQIQTKFRNEPRAKSGILRGREFLMKDLYSFDKTEEDFRKFYEEAAGAYLKIFERIGIGKQTYRTFASGGDFSKFSDEFQTVAESGEDTIYIDEKKRVGVNKEVFEDDVLKELSLDKKKMVEKKAIEVGNIFPLGTKYSEAAGLKYRDENEAEHPVIMGSYGIGPGRVMGTVVELNNDDSGIIWPKAIAPFDAHLIVLAGQEGMGTRTNAEKLYTNLEASGIEVLYDDRDMRPGEKFAEADLIGIPTRIVVSEKTIVEGKYEVKDRRTGDVQMMSEAELTTHLK